MTLPYVVARKMKYSLSVLQTVHLAVHGLIEGNNFADLVNTYFFSAVVGVLLPGRSQPTDVVGIGSVAKAAFRFTAVSIPSDHARQLSL